MHDNLRLYDQHLRRLRQLMPQERITRVRNLALLVSGLIQSGSVHLSHIARQWPTAAKLPSLENRLRRFLSNPRLSVQRLIAPWRVGCWRAPRPGARPAERGRPRFA
jgi:hypothetical protein